MKVLSGTAELQAGLLAASGQAECQLQREYGALGLKGPAFTNFNPLSLAQRSVMSYCSCLELRPNDLASPRTARQTDDLLPKLEFSRLRHRGL